MNMSLSYPLGHFTPQEQPTAEQRAGWIEDIAALPADLKRTVAEFTPEQLRIPYRPGGWSTQQVVHHLADNDMNAYIRFKRALTEESPLAGSYREDLWAELADYEETPIVFSLQLLESLRHRFVILLRTLPAEQFQRCFTSPTHGAMTLEQATQRFAWHGRHHLAQISSLKQRLNG
ncbi:YfiT family bacillithiol transferase [Paenibacillus donghaensis]|uniref:Metal-dependent hydrolase n=1 Tax=Paenibacillus donghaensis TaxID=414771 RepID=A0A2Z2KHP5_9BACL|nr:putative metal-dependent hydrolase [Paenibacillus donghaensis]ASA21709.1 metal-dependent hydrolase [Paenibacillus donghaensis]